MSNNQLIAGKSHLIPLEEAIAMNDRYRKQKDDILAPGVPTDTLCICETFNREDFDTLLAQNDCVGVRIYYGMHDNGEVAAVIVGVNSDNKDIINPDSAVIGDNIILDNSARCPYDCPPPSVLNS